jgi:GTP-binding protein Era
MATRAGFIAIAGRPNAGKSTLLNKVLGAKVSIVTPKAQTTRERVLGILTEGDGQIVFVDTPGIHRAKEGGINAYMMSEVREALADVSAVWYVVDPESHLKHEEPVLELLSKARVPVFLLLNKMDVRGADEYRAATDRLVGEVTDKARELGVEIAQVARISARHGAGVKELLEATWPLIPEAPFYYEDPDQLSDRPTRFFVAEKVREQLFLCLGEELPYACAVEIEKFDEASQPPRIEATIYVERDSQKGMVIGKGAAKIKEIGSGARKEIEKFLGGGQVFLGLKVKVLKDWSRDAETLRRLGYNLPPQGGKSGKKRTA